MIKEKVYFTKNISRDSLIKIYEEVGFELKGKVGVKISTGEPGGHNFLNPNLIAPLVQKLNGTIIESCTAYGGKRQDPKMHWQVIKEHGFLDIAPCDILDEEGETKIPCPHQKHLEYDIVGKNIANYDAILILSHFKGHAMGGFGGALKNMSIGIASSSGKALIHTAGKSSDVATLWQNKALQDDFLESMAEADLAIINYQANILYINVLNNISVDCDCDSNPEDPCMHDIGILASTDPVAIDRASLDLISKSSDPGSKKIMERVISKNGEHILDYAEEIGVGSKDYELITID